MGTGAPAASFGSCMGGGIAPASCTRRKPHSPRHKITSALIRPDKDCHIDFTNVFSSVGTGRIARFCRWKGRYFRFREVFLMRIGFIGAGKVGTALGLYFKKHGLVIAGYRSRSEASARRVVSREVRNLGTPKTNQAAFCSSVCMDCGFRYALETDQSSAYSMR